MPQRVSLAQWKKLSPAQKKSLRARISGHGAYKVRSRRVRGRGDYKVKNYSYSKPGPFGKVGRSLGKAAGNYLGGPIGGQVGEAVGGLAHYIGKIFGSGDYVTNSEGIKENSIVLSQQIPQFGGGASTTRIRHREYLGDVLTSSVAGAFSITNYALNPGLANSLPWLSQVCGSTYQQYRINGMIFEFRSMSADALNSTNTALGSVIMCTDYDSKDSVFTSKQQMENTLFGVSCKPSSCMIHAIECARSQTAVSELYIRAGAVPNGADIRLYDLGRFSIATVGGQAANVNLGELWVSYDVTLFKPIEQPPGFLIDYANFNLAATDATKPLLLNTAIFNPQPALNTFAGDFTLSDTAIQFPLSIQVNSVYMMHYVVKGASTAGVIAPSVTFSGGLTSNLSSNGISKRMNLQGTSESNAWTPTPAATMNTCCVSYFFMYTGGGTLAVPPTITFGTAGVYPGTVSSAGLMITQLPSVPA